MYAILSFDVEDIYFPSKYCIDDIPGWLAEIMTEYGLKGTFMVMGEKARLLKKRGRNDVIQKMALHDIASHTQGNQHPLIPEILQDKGWDDGVQAMREYEDEVKKDLYKVFGYEPAAFSMHNTYFAPQHVAVAGERGIPYIYGVARIKGYNQPTWYAGTLTFPDGLDTPSSFAGFDLIYSRDELFKKQLQALDNFLRERVERGFEYVTIFACHPVRVMSRGWQEHYCLASGMTRKPEELGWLYGVKSKEEKKRAKANFRQLIKFLKDCPYVEIVGANEATRLFSTQLSHISRDALTFYAREIEKVAKPVFHSAFSPAELVCAFSESLIYAEEHGDLPTEVVRRDVLGPKSRPVIGIEKDIITHKELISLCLQVRASVLSKKHLPANVEISNGRVGLGQFLLLAARSYLTQTHYEKYEKLRIQQVQRYPDNAFELDNWIRYNLGEHWGLPLDYSCDKMAEQARLQTWTMKPAWLKPPQGPVFEGERILL